MLRWVNGWTFFQTLAEVAKFLGMQPRRAIRPFEAPKTNEEASEPQQNALSFSGTIVYAGMQDYK